ncbi:MAG: methyltransferase domain-containing protein [Candidatus Brocadiia bacterium]
MVEKKRQRSFAERLRDGVLFFAHFITDPFGLSSPFSSSPQIAEAVAEELAAHGVRRVVELGSGVGALTRGILEALGPEDTLMCIERKPAFCRRLEQRFDGRVKVVEGDALDLPELVAGTAWECPDAVVCSVPLMNFSAHDLCGAVHRVLPADGLYIQLANRKGPMKEFFTIEKTHFFPRNLPPEQLHRAYPRSDVSNT